MNKRMNTLYYKQDPENEAKWLEKKTHPAKKLREGHVVVFVPHGVKITDPIPASWGVVRLAEGKDERG